MPTKGVSRDLALRVYTTRLLGGEPRLVLHGGGNTSMKTRVTDLVGDAWDVLCVKGSGWDMGVIEPQGLPAVKLAPLLKARALKSLSDEDMVSLQRANLIDPSSPNPSVETLLHAFLPHRFVDHTHSTAILAFVDQEDSEPLCREVFGKKMGFVPYIKPGFDLAKVSAEIYEQDPQRRRADPRQARHLHLRRDGPGSLRPDDPLRHHGGGLHRVQGQARASAGRAAQALGIASRRSRRRCAARWRSPRARAASTA